MISTNTTLNTDLINSYLETEYHVLAKLPFTLHPGQTSNELKSLHAERKVICSAFITAWNPYSKPTDQATNNKHQNQLVKELSIKGFSLIQGLGKHSTGKWEGEESILVLGLNIEAAKATGIKYGQNAILWINGDGIPQLILLK